MAVNIGSTPIADAKLGSTQVKAIYLGATKVWEKLRVQSGFRNLNRNTVSTTATVSYSISTDGTEAGVGGVGGFTGTWLLSGSASDYDVQLVLSSGSTPTGASVNTWLNLGTGRYWELQQTTAGSKTANVVLKIRDATTLTELLSIPATFEVSKES